MDERDRQRDWGLDCVRVLALLLMAGIHFFKVLPEAGPLSRTLHFAGDGAAGFFFFAFGMTAPRYHAKSASQKLASTLPFLFVALAHNVYVWRRLEGVDFLFFLLLWRLILAAIAISFPRPARAAAGLFVAIAAALLAVPDTTGLNRIFTSAITGFFALLPWGLFVLGGFVYAEWRPRPAVGIAVSLTAVVAALACDAAALPLGRASLALEKWPLDTPYALFFCGLSVLCVELARLWRPDDRTRPPGAIARGVRFLSAHLLLATALHYLAVHLLTWLTPHLALLRPASHDEGRVVAAIALSWSIALAVLFLVVPASVALGRRLTPSRPCAWLRRHTAFVAVALLLVISLVNSPYALRLFFDGSPAGLPEGLALGVLIYFALEADLARTPVGR